MLYWLNCGVQGNQRMNYGLSVGRKGTSGFPDVLSDETINVNENRVRGNPARLSGQKPQVCITR